MNQDTTQTAQNDQTRIAHLERQVEDLSVLVRTMLTKQKKAETEDTDRSSPVAWTDRASKAEWDALVFWVDWLRATYAVMEDRAIPACWPAHRGLANELAALNSAWVAASRAEQKKDKQAMIHWHDRWLAPVFTRTRMYDCRPCNNHMHHRSLPPPPTTRDLIPTPGEYITAALDDGPDD